MKFTDLELKPEILKALEVMGFSELTPIQEQTFTAILANRDIMALAETGSGKTSACGIPLVQKINPADRDIQGLILVPTRELALQYVTEIDKICRFLRISPFAVYGGFPMDIQKAKLNDGVHILIATPGRLIDHLYHGDLTLSSVKTLVLDEADEMLNMGFIDDVKFIMSCIIAEHQTLLFSATMPADIVDLATAFLHDPITVELNRENIAPQNIAHYFRFLPARERLTALKQYLQNAGLNQAIIFCNSKHNGETLFGQLKKDFKSLEYIHGGLDQSHRTSIFNRFKKQGIKILLATDVAGRGLDFSHVSHVINFDFPRSAEIYTHRTGRTGRMGNSGTAMTLVTNRDLPILDRLLRDNRITPRWDGAAPDPGQTGPSKKTVDWKTGRRANKDRPRRQPAARPKSPRSEDAAGSN